MRASTAMTMSTVNEVCAIMRHRRAPIASPSPVHRHSVLLKWVLISCWIGFAHVFETTKRDAECYKRQSTYIIYQLKP